MNEFIPCYVSYIVRGVFWVGWDTNCQSGRLVVGLDEARPLN